MNNSYWLSSVEMGGYRTIKDVSVSFQPGLNIIIGKNGTGKTNFFEFLYNTLKMKFQGVSEFHANLDLYYAENEIKINVKGEPVKKIRINDSIKSLLSAEIKFNDDERKYFSRFIMENSDDVYLSEMSEYLYQKEVNISEVNKINYGIPKNIPGLNELFSAIIVGEKIEEYKEGSIGHILFNFCEKYKQNGSYNLQKMRENFANELDKLNNTISLKKFRNFLQTYTPIQDVRFNQSILMVEKENSIEFTNFINEFKIHNDWYFFDDLSDGTKRMVWIIFAFRYNINAKIILLEEPELGIHPHQLNLLMKFLKEQSQEKQIILTTHAPQCLDILEPDELDRIIICEMEGKRTKLSHLDEKKKEKAKKYMEDEDILSNYWRFSDLER